MEVAILKLAILLTDLAYSHKTFLKIKKPHRGKSLCFLINFKMTHSAIVKTYKLQQLQDVGDAVFVHNDVFLLDYVIVCRLSEFPYNDVTIWESPRLFNMTQLQRYPIELRSTIICQLKNKCAAWNNFSISQRSKYVSTFNLRCLAVSCVFLMKVISKRNNNNNKNIADEARQQISNHQPKCLRIFSF